MLAPVLFFFFSCFAISAQQEQSESLIRSTLLGWEIELKAGFKVGGTSPIPIPEEIREIQGYSPTLSIPFEVNISKLFNTSRKWGITTGLKLENKNMLTRARVKSYSMEIIGDGGEKVSGHWTGNVRTKIHNTYITVPILAVYCLDKRWKLRSGAFLSVLTEGDFSGHVYEGYMREIDPTGPKFEFTDDQIATYDFSKDLRRFAYGVQVGASWRAFKRLNVYGDFSWGLNDIFKSDFNTISFAMYPIYADFGFGYVF